MKVIEALKSKNVPIAVRVDNKSLYWDEKTEEWVVFRHFKNTVYRGTDEDMAVWYLLRLDS